MVEEVAGRWLLDVLGLPADSGVGFITGAHMANFTALAAARHELLRARAGTSRRTACNGAPRLRVSSAGRRM